MQNSNTASISKVTHYGTIRVGDVALECVVLNDGKSGYVQRQFMQAVGFYGKNPGSRFRRFLAETAPNALNIIDNSESQVVKMPSGGDARFIPSGTLTEVVAGVMDAALDGTLHPQRQGILPNCRALYRALAKTGEEALIHEATGYQYHRAPDALQDLFAKLIRQTAADWERRFHPDFYQAIYRLFKWEYNPAKPKPNVVGQITLRWVYEPVFPTEILIEIKERQQSEKIHQWLEDGGIHLLEKQRDAVMMIARTSADYADFNARCSVAFFRRGQISILFPAGEA